MLASIFCKVLLNTNREDPSTDCDVGLNKSRADTGSGDIKVNRSFASILSAGSTLNHLLQCRLSLPASSGSLNSVVYPISVASKLNKSK